MSLKKVTLLGSNLASVTDLKRIETPHSLCCDFGGYKPLQLVGQAAEFKFESKFEPLPVIWQSLRRLFQKVIEGLEGKINCQLVPSSWGSSVALLVRVGRASTNTRRFLISGSRCGCDLRSACLRKTCYHSCDTDLA